MDKLEFKPEKFGLKVYGSYDIEMMPTQDSFIKVSDLAEMLSSAVVVYGDETHQDWYLANMAATHKALLINIEPIAKEPCKHEPSSGITTDFYCLHCGVELVAEWKEKGSINE